MRGERTIDRIQELSPKKRELFLRKFVTLISVAGQEDYKSKKILAYVLGDESFDKHEVEDYLKLHLPGYMIPEEIVRLEHFPTLPNGKLDVKRLREQRTSIDVEHAEVVHASNAVEKELVGIWEDVMHFHPVSIHDNFFEIGGDSIISIQMIAKARKAGILIDNEKLLTHQTIQSLAKHVVLESNSSATVKAERFVGPVQLSPIQRWFFEEHLSANDHWNLALSVEILSKDLSPEILKTIFKNLVDLHEGLRLRFDSEEDTFSAQIGEVGAFDAFKVVDLDLVPKEERTTAIRQHVEAAQSGFNLPKGTLFQAIYFCFGDEQHDELFLIAHHLVMDNLSWRIVLNNIEEQGTRIISKQELESSTSHQISYRDWIGEIDKLAVSGFFDGEYEFWKSQVQTPNPFPTDHALKNPITEERIKTVGLEFDQEVSYSLLRKAHSAYNTSTEELLIVALLLAFEKWKGITQLCLGLEKHGRHAFGSITEDMSSIIGWFTTYFPITLHLDSQQGIATGIKTVKEQLRSVPNNGLGYGVLRYMQSNRNEQNSLSQSPHVVFNFLGNRSQKPGKLLGTPKTIDFNSRSPLSERNYLMEINLYIENESLKLVLSYSAQAFEDGTMDTFIDFFDKTLRNVVDHCMDQKESHYSASDFSEAELSADDLEKLLNSQ